MADQLDASMIERYLANSNEVFHINFTRDGEDVFPEPFNPAFTYPIFGEDETIIGYAAPRIDLTFDATTLRPHLKFRYEDKFKAIGTTEAMDVVGAIKDFLPESASAPNGAAVQGISQSRPPPGRKVKSYTRDGRTFEVWCASLSDDRAREMLRNMRILVPLFIEGGTACHFLDDPDWSIARWKLWLQYETTDDVYTLAGFATSYRLWVFPGRSVRTAMGEASIPSPPASEPEVIKKFDSDGHPYYDEADPAPVAYPEQMTPPPTYPEPAAEDSNILYAGDYSPLDDAPSRERISQFIILPPFQRGGHGTALYDAMVDVFRADKSVFEITVEDPNEQFDELRDYQDLAYLRTLPNFRDLKIADKVPDGSLDRDEYVPVDHLIDQKVLTSLRYESKIMPRQFRRLVEMQLYASIPPLHRSNDRQVRKEKASNAEDRRFFFLKLFMKHRIYIQNADQLIQLDEEERGPKVAEAVGAQMQEYAERLDVFEKRQRRYADADSDADAGAAASNGSVSARKGKGKRRVVEDDEDEDEGVAKRAKLS